LIGGGGDEIAAADLAGVGERPLFGAQQTAAIDSRRAGMRSLRFSSWQREFRSDGRRRVWRRRLSVNFSVTFVAVPYALLNEGAGMTNTAGIPGDRICSFVERVERIDEEIKALNEGKKEVFAEAKGEGFDVKVLKEILRLRKQDKDERDEQESLLDLYLRAMESAGSSQAKAA
jgi:uncharacterized protein (UPF0335 family)